MKNAKKTSPILYKYTHNKQTFEITNKIKEKKRYKTATKKKRSNWIIYILISILRSWKSEKGSNKNGTIIRKLEQSWNNPTIRTICFENKWKLWKLQM